MRRSHHEAFQTPEQQIMNIMSRRSIKVRRLDFRTDRDEDSSDEEDEMNPISSSISPKGSIVAPIPAADIALSMLGHSLGIYYMYSEKVQERYYDLEFIQRFKGHEKYVSSCSLFGRDKKITVKEPLFDLTNIGDRDFAVEFLSYIRLHNLDEKRHLYNKEKCKDTKWKITKNFEPVELTNSSEFNNKGLRHELVDFDGYNLTYQKAFEKQRPNDLKILLESRLKIQERAGELESKNILSLWYLLFGCEVMKNPAALIHNNMVLDLASSNGGVVQFDKMPMSQAGVIIQASKLNSLYSPFMPRKYLYDKEYEDYEGVEGLIRAESDIMKDWLLLKLEEDQVYALIAELTDTEERAGAIKQITDLIFNEAEKWGLSKASFTDYNQQREAEKEIESQKAYEKWLAEEKEKYAKLLAEKEQERIKEAYENSLDVTELLLEHSNDYSYVKFGIDHYHIDYQLLADINRKGSHDLETIIEYLGESGVHLHTYEV